MKRLITVWMVIVLFGTGYARAGTWTTLDLPGEIPHHSWITGISGNNLVGYTLYADVSNFLYNGTNWTSLDIPDALGSANVMDISGNNIVGYCHAGSSREHGLFYNSSSWTTLDVPDAGSGGATIMNGISGSNIVGYYQDASYNQHGFLYNTIGQTWTTLDVSGSNATAIFGIDSSNLVGEYQDGSGGHGFLYNTTTRIWTTIDKPGAIGSTRITGISGNNLVGINTSGYHGFLYNLPSNSWTELDAPGAYMTYIYGIDGDNVVGAYFSNNVEGIGCWHGFVYTIPEPATLLLLGLGAVMLRRKR